MLSTETRLRLEQIAQKIKTGQQVTLEERIWAEKWSKSNASAASIIRKATRIAFQGEAPDGTIDKLLQDLDLGDPDPQNHKTGNMSADDLFDFFHNDDNDRLKRD